MEGLAHFLEALGPGHASALRLGFEPLIPWPAAIGLWLVVAGLWAGYVWRRGRARAWRASGLALIALALMGPALIHEKREALKDGVVLVIDDSASQRIAGRAAVTEKAAAALNARLSADPTLEVHVVRAAGDRDGTKLFGPAEREAALIGRDRLAGTILLTDGQVHDAPATPKGAARLGPLHALIVGDPAAGDRRLSVITQPQFGIVGANSEVEIEIDDNGAQSGSGSAMVRLELNEDKVFTYRVRTGAPQKLRFRLDRRGENVVTLTAEPGPQELSLINNEASFTVSGVRDRLRVLLVTGAPYPGGRVWRNLLRSDPAVDLVHFTILRPPDKQDATPEEELSLIPFPTRELFEEKLNGFDLIIFDRYTRDSVLPLLYFANISNYVEKGGALLVVAGPSYAGSLSLSTTPLAAVLPTRPNGRVETRAFRPVITALGRTNPVTRGLEPGPGEAPWGQWNLAVGADVIDGQTLLATPAGAPLLTLATVGKGRAGILLSDQIWLWARGYDGGGPYAELMRRTAHWLMKEPELDAERLSAHSDGETIEIARQTSAATAPAVEAIAPSGRRRMLNLSASTTPGRFETVIPADELGLWRLRSGALEARVGVGPANPRESSALTPTTDILRPAVDATGGGVFVLGADAAAHLPMIRRIAAGAGEAAAGEHWLGLKRRGAYAVRNVESLPFPPPLVLALAGLATLIMAWRREGR